MKYLFVLLCIFLISCKSNPNSLSSEDINIDDSILMQDIIFDSTITPIFQDTLSKSIIIDSTKLIEPDIFYFSEDINDYFKINKKYPFYKCKTTNALLIFEPYTDGSITNTILSRDINLPKSYLEFLSSDGLNIKDKPLLINEIKSIKGIDINSKEKDFIQLFGNPDSIINKSKNKILYWNFFIKESKSKIYDSRNFQPFILHGLQFNIEARFIQDKLQLLTYSYEVP